jgi:hypothetical protein
MNYRGVDIYARNRGSRVRGTGHDATMVHDPVELDCPFCGRPTKSVEGRITEHVERLGFTRCPGSGVQPHTAARRAASLTADYLLASEGLYE